MGLNSYAARPATAAPCWPAIAMCLLFASALFPRASVAALPRFERPYASCLVGSGGMKIGLGADDLSHPQGAKGEPSIFNVAVRPSTETRSLQYLVTVVNGDIRTRRVDIGGRLSPATPGARWRYPAIPVRAVTLAPGEIKTVFMGPLPWREGSDSFWWPNIPYRAGYRAQLHLLTLTMKSSSGARKMATEAQVRFGFCTPAQTGDAYTLNGIPIKLRGDTISESTFGAAAFSHQPGFGAPNSINPGWPGAIANYQRLNFNVLMIRHAPCTRYMMDVCDERGMLVIPDASVMQRERSSSNEERPGTAQIESLRSLVLRERNHPCVFKWNLASVDGVSAPGAIKPLYDACRSADPIRPCSIEASDSSEIAYSEKGFTVIRRDLPVDGNTGSPEVAARHDRPFGQGEYRDSISERRSGAVQYALISRAIRSKGYSEIRPFRLTDLWPGAIPGNSAQSTKKSGQRYIISGATPFADERILLLQRSYAPIAVHDIEYDKLNAPSNLVGQWPSVPLRFQPASAAVRRLAVYNDTLKPASIQIHLAPYILLDGGHVEALPPFHRVIRAGAGKQTEIVAPVAIPGANENRPLRLILTANVDGREVYRETILGAVMGGSASARYAGRVVPSGADWPGAFGSEAFLVSIVNGNSAFQVGGVAVQRGVGFLPDPAAPANVLSAFKPLQSEQMKWDSRENVPDPRLPVHGPGGLNDRAPTAFLGEANGLVIRADISDGKAHALSLYFVDYQRRGLAQQVDLFDLRGNLLATHTVSSFQDGAYERFIITGSVVVRVLSTDIHGAILSAVFVDAAE